MLYWLHIKKETQQGFASEKKIALAKAFNTKLKK